MRRNLAPNRLASAITGELRNQVLRGLIQDQERVTQAAIDAHNAKVMDLVGRPVGELVVTRHENFSAAKVDWTEKGPQDIISDMKNALEEINSPEYIERHRQLQIRAQAEAMVKDQLIDDMFYQKLKEREGKTADQLADEQEKWL